MLQQHHRLRLAGAIAEGRRLERAAIVADLRREAETEDSIDATVALIEAAEQYERGKHVKEGE